MALGVRALDANHLGFIPRTKLDDGIILMSKATMQSLDL